MGYKDIKAGTKTAKAIAARFIRSKTDKLGMEVAFQFEENGTMEKLSWVGWLTDAALENTMRTLVDVLGYNGDESVDMDGVLTHPQVLDFSRQVSLVVELEAYTGTDGVERQSPKIQWVNKLAGSQFAACEPQTVKTGLLALGFKAAFLKAKSINGHAPAVGNMQQAKNAFDESKLPF